MDPKRCDSDRSICFLESLFYFRVNNSLTYVTRRLLTFTGRRAGIEATMISNGDVDRVEFRDSDRECISCAFTHKNVDRNAISRARSRKSKRGEVRNERNRLKYYYNDKLAR